MHDVRDVVARVYADDSRRVLATLIRLLGDFDLAEEALQEAFAAALAQWSADGVPDNPRAWLVSAGRFRAIDALRRRARLERSAADVAEALHDGPAGPVWNEEEIEDDRLRLIFTCCHPALPSQSQVALTLREVCDLTTDEIARAFLTPVSTVAQRIVRAKKKIRENRIPYEVPVPAELPERLDGVLRVIYLVFNEGYSASAGAALTRPVLSSEALRLGRLLVELLPEPEAMGLLGLLLLHEARRAARTSPDGDLVLLDEQDRSLWARDLIAEGTALVERALTSRRFGPYTLQGAIAAVHAEAPTMEDTDWAEIVALYDVLLRADPTPVVELNRAIAVAMRDGPEAGLRRIEAILVRGTSPTTSRPMRPAANSCDGSDGTMTHATRLCRPWRSPARSRNGACSNGAWTPCGKDQHDHDRADHHRPPLVRHGGRGSRPLLHVRLRGRQDHQHHDH